MTDTILDDMMEIYKAAAKTAPSPESDRLIHECDKYLEELTKVCHDLRAVSDWLKDAIAQRKDMRSA